MWRSLFAWSHAFPSLAFLLLLASCGGSGNGASEQGAASAQSWSVALNNATDTCYKPGATLQLVVSAADSTGQSIANPQYAVSAAPASGLETDAQGRMVVRGEGPLELTVSYTGSQSATSTIVPQVFQLMRDGTAPVITVTSPLRGAMRQTTTNNDTVDITGNVADSLSPLKVVVVNEDALTLSGSNTSEPIAVTRPARWGTNIVRIRATDACGNAAEQVQSFLQSTAYLAPAVTQNLAARVPNASAMRLARAAIDDGNRADLDDVTSVAERFLKNNLAAGLNQFLVAIPTQTSDVLSCTFSANPIAAATIAAGSPTLELVLQNGKFTFSFTIHDVRIPVTYREVCRGLLGNVISDISATFVHGVATLTVVVGVTPHVASRQFTTSQTADITIAGVSLDSSSNPTLAAAINAATNNQFFSNQVNTLLDLAVTPLFEFVAGATVNDALSILTRVVPIQFPSPINKTLNAAVDWTAVGVTATAVTLELGQYVFPSAVGTPYAGSRGAISRGVVTRPLADLPGAPLTYGLNDDGVNQMLWALWYGGGLELRDVQTYAAALSGVGLDLTGVKLDVSGLLPPVIMPSDDPAQVILSLGDVHVTGSVDLDRNAALAGSGVVSFDVYASLLTDGSTGFDIAGNALDLRLGDLSDQFYLQVNALQLNGSPVTAPEQARALKAYLRGVIRPLLGQLGRDAGARIQLPQFKIDFPVQSFGANAGFVLDIVSLKRDQDRFVVSVDPDDAYAPVVNIGNWGQLANAAIAAASVDAAAWLKGAKVSCRTELEFARSEKFRNTYDLTDGVKQALMQAGAPESVARDWNRVFKSAWLAWGEGLAFADLPWFPDFAGSNFLSGVPHFSAAVTGPLGSLASRGRDRMSRASLKQELEFVLQDYLGQPGASAAVDTFATEISSRLDTQLQIGTIDGVTGAAIYPDPILAAGGTVIVTAVGVVVIALNPEVLLKLAGVIGGNIDDIVEALIDFWPPPPDRGPLIGACLPGGTFGGNAFQ